ncbi:hypothetical protein DTL42_11835 [Bremerella cremea]|uniref:RedB protein n=1 Tax=Bremerella cremea TaxID=1031537 RepID=A0A368KQY4_9BACT|nr:hypothetical protein [Bremerella cremea]RCS49221.1 hypothetical protein DTL42_11835 [Bremerella cremea]
MESSFHIREGSLNNNQPFALYRLFLPVMIAVWIGLIGIGFITLLAYQNTSGQATDSQLAWPNSTYIHRDSKRCNLLLFLHPRCTCSLATLKELARLQTHCQDKLAIQIVLFQPSHADHDWLDSQTVDLANQIPKTYTIIDKDGVEATRFGATTSGQVILFAPNGKRVFSGGITPSRAHEGDNLGSQAIEAYVCRGDLSVDQTKVFGCPLLGPGERSYPEPRTLNDRAE